MIGRTQILAMAAFLAVGWQSCAPALAGPSGGNPPSSNVNYEDMLYDFELWWVHDVTRYYVVAEFTDGHVEEYEFMSQGASDDFVAWLYFHIADVENAYVEKGSKTVEEYVATYDTRAEAKHWGLALPGGYKIVRVSGSRSDTTSMSGR